LAQQEAGLQLLLDKTNMATSLHSFSTLGSTEVCFEPSLADLTPDELIQECAAGGNASSWKEFIRRFQPMIAGVVARAAMRWTQVSPDLVNDLLQETYMKLCTEEYRHLRRFSSRHDRAIYSFLKTIASNATTDYFRSQFARKRGHELLCEDGLDLALQKGQEGCVENHVLLQEIEGLLDQITDSEQDKRVFWLYFQQGFTAKAIAERPGIKLSLKGVESCLQRLTSHLRDMCQRHESNLNERQEKISACR
jgi:RNA polymerase sigma-70 factor (ECF subfamily)